MKNISLYDSRGENFPRNIQQTGTHASFMIGILGSRETGDLSTPYMELTKTVYWLLKEWSWACHTF